MYNIFRETLLREAALHRRNPEHNRRRQDKQRRRPVKTLFLLLLVPAFTAHPMLNNEGAAYAGARVKMIPVTTQIDAWHAVDARHVILTFAKAGDYLLTLGRDCQRLSHAHNLGVSTSNNAIYAGFDYLTADNEKCAISAINKIERAE